MKSLNEIEKLLADKVANNQKEAKECEDQIQKAKQSIKQANENLLQAEKDVDLEAYNKAKDTIWASSHAKELYLKRKEKLLKEPLITKAEYHQLVEEIKQTANEAQESYNQKALPFIVKLKEIADQSNQVTEQTNQLLHILQRNVYKEPEGVLKLANGTTTYSADIEYKEENTVHQFYQSKIKGTPLAQQAVEEEPLDTFKYWG